MYPWRTMQHAQNIIRNFVGSFLINYNRNSAHPVLWPEMQLGCQLKNETTKIAKLYWCAYGVIFRFLKIDRTEIKVK